MLNRKKESRKRDRRIKIHESEITRIKKESLFAGIGIGLGGAFVINTASKLFVPKKNRALEHRGSMECLCK